MHPFQAVVLQIQVLDDRRGRCQRIERTEPVRDESLRHAVIAANRATERRFSLQDQDIPARVSEHVSRDQTIWAGADHYTIDLCRQGRHRSSLGEKPPRRQSEPVAAR